MVQTEPWLERDRAMIDTLRTIGIEKGKPFAPDDGMKAALEEAAAQAHALLDAKLEASSKPVGREQPLGLPRIAGLHGRGAVRLRRPGHLSGR